MSLCNGVKMRQSQRFTAFASKVRGLLLILLVGSSAKREKLDIDYLSSERKRDLGLLDGRSTGHDTGPYRFPDQ